MAIFNSVPRHFLYMYLRTSWSAVTVNVVPEIRALLFEVPPNVIPETTQTTTLLVLWEGQEMVMDSSPVHLLRYRLLPKHQRFEKRYTNIRCSNYHNTGIDGNLKKNTKRRSALNCVLVKSITLFSCKRVEKFRAKYWKPNRTILKKRDNIYENGSKNILIEQSNQKF